MTTFSQDKKAQILAAWLDGVPIKIIAHRFQCAYSYPAMLARRSGINRDRRRSYYRARGQVKRDWLFLREL